MFSKKIGQKKETAMFVDRCEAQTLVKNEYNIYQEQEEYFKVISFYGIGGIGKTRLVNKLMQNITSSDVPLNIILINMDIMHSAEMLENLIKVRRQIKERCFYFDYGLMLIWDTYFASTYNEEYLFKLKESYIAYLQVITGYIPYIPDLSSLIRVIRSNIQQIELKYLLNKDIICEIDARFKRSAEDVYQILPQLLGLDFRRIAIKKRIITFFDSYNQYIVDHDDWLKDLIDSAGIGLFVVTSREELNWNLPESNYISFELKELPQYDAEQILRTVLAAQHYSNIPIILEKSGRIPLFIELAISIYKNLPDYSINTVKNTFWGIEKERDFVKAFLYHLPTAHQQIAKLFSVIRIFNKDIYEWMVKCLNLPIDVLEYYKICDMGLVNFLEDDHAFLKLHDQFCINAVAFLKPQECQEIFNIYIKYVATRGMLVLTDQQILILFRNIISIAQQIDVEKEQVEYICDVFFLLYENHRVPTIETIVNECTALNLQPFCTMAKSLFLERKDAVKSHDLASSINDVSAQLGRHCMSLQLIMSYSKAISGDYETTFNMHEMLYKQLRLGDEQYWYYGKAVIYYADHLMLRGKFIQAISLFGDYKTTLEGLPRSFSNTFEVSKQIAHCKRFNMLLDDAYYDYNYLLTEFNYSSKYKLYALTSLCETSCFFHSECLSLYTEEALELCELLDRKRDKAKIYTSLAIACIHKTDFYKAYQLLDDAISLNDATSYPMGNIFVFIARAYVEYAQFGKPTEATILEIERLIEFHQVYRFLKLPIDMMLQNVDKEWYSTNFEWIDFNHTICEYERLLNKFSRHYAR